MERDSNLCVLIKPKTCQKQREGLTVRFKQAGFDSRVDSIPNAGHSFEKLHFSFRARVEKGSLLMKRTVNWEKEDGAACSFKKNWKIGRKIQSLAIL